MKKVLFGAFLCLSICLLDSFNVGQPAEIVAEDIWQPIPQEDLERFCDVVYVPPVSDEPIRKIPVREFSYEDAQILLRVGTAEAEGEGTMGIYKVLNVVYNRLISNRYPNTIEGVVFQENAFTSTQNGRYNRCEITEQAHEALCMLESGFPIDENIVGFEIAGNRTLDKYYDYAYTYGNHDFYVEKGALK